jgi:hypothetical protein
LDKSASDEADAGGLVDGAGVCEGVDFADDGAVACPIVVPLLCYSTVLLINILKGIC